MAVFGGNKEDTAPSLTDVINAYRQQGYQDSQISQYLQSQGHSLQEITAAMGTSSPPPPPSAPSPSRPPPSASSNSSEREQIQEVAEAVVEEKWKSLLESLNKLNEWKESTETRVTKLEQDINNVQTNFDSLHKGILGKISEYDKNLVDVGTSIKSMDKVFKEVLPTFTENVNKLDRITKAVHPPVRPGNRPPVRK